MVTGHDSKQKNWISLDSKEIFLASLVPKPNVSRAFLLTHAFKMKLVC